MRKAQNLHRSTVEPGARMRQSRSFRAPTRSSFARSSNHGHATDGLANHAENAESPRLGESSSRSRSASRARARRRRGHRENRTARPLLQWTKAGRILSCCRRSLRFERDGLQRARRRARPQRDPRRGPVSVAQRHRAGSREVTEVPDAHGAHREVVAVCGAVRRNVDQRRDRTARLHLEERVERRRVPVVGCPGRRGCPARPWRSSRSPPVRFARELTPSEVAALP